MNTKTSMQRVAVWGVFDALHVGHVAFLKWAQQYGELHVIIIPDSIVRKYKCPLLLHNQDQRRENLMRLADPDIANVYFDCVDLGLSCINNIAPDVFCFGHDQNTIYESQLRCHIESLGQRVTYQQMPNNAHWIRSSYIRGYLFHDDHNNNPINKKLFLSRPNHIINNILSANNIETRYIDRAILQNYCMFSIIDNITASTNVHRGHKPVISQPNINTGRSLRNHFVAVTSYVCGNLTTLVGPIALCLALALGYCVIFLIDIN